MSSLCCCFGMVPSFDSSLINPILIWVYLPKWGWPDLRHSNSNLSNSGLKASSSKPTLLLSFSTCIFHISLVVLASSCPSLQTPTLFSKHAHHPSSTHACTISLHSPLSYEPLFPSISTSPLDPLSNVSYFDLGLCGLCCPCILLIQISQRMGEGCLFPCCCQGAALALRVKLRTENNIQVSAAKYAADNNIGIS